ncbi:response regulator [Aliiglaciecola sp. CAU 1673]|uniref:response regulator n=1 Tax=Aliiglaciecola sp. CAU 1673 TaxID=3032595 RepID=UPI0023D9BD14|nr:response regulator [Aliiglaciecola sp. CAU 1673]MDF2179515.1 response regulator [Aliiglaciecola sp. CAU 1673]
MDFPVLICDDSMLARKAAQRALPVDWPVELLFAADGMEAMGILRQQHIGLLLLDMTMPNMDGMAVLEAIREEKIETFVVVVSADVQPQSQARALELGALAFLPKPISSACLKQVLTDYGLYRVAKRLASA